jgi:4,4'-diaponeurosporenoate glycosyltransferase
MLTIHEFTIIAGLILSIILFFRFPQLGQAETSDSFRKISIIIPVRNEEKNLPGILGDLKNQTWKNFEIICVNDNSDDNTEAIIRQYDLKQIDLTSLPTDWKGKTWACQQGAEQAEGDILLFIDADVRLSPDALEKLVKTYKGTKGPLSVQPFHTVKKTYEFFSFFFNLIQLCSTGMTLAGMKNTMGFYGPVLMISKITFFEYGGYTPVKNEVLEDFKLGKFYKEHGIRLSLFTGGNFIKFRMYGESFKSLIEGWTKNFSQGAVATYKLLVLAIILWIGYLTVLPVRLVMSVTEKQVPMIVFFILVYLITVLILNKCARNTGSFPFAVSLFYPVFLSAFYLIFLYSVLATFFFKNTTWKGRKM